jgi:hypothetical protein
MKRTQARSRLMSVLIGTGCLRVDRTLPASSLGLAVDPPEEGGGCWVGGLG